MHAFGDADYNVPRPEADHDERDRVVLDQTVNNIVNDIVNNSEVDSVNFSAIHLIP